MTEEDIISPRETWVDMLEDIYPIGWGAALGTYVITKVVLQATELWKIKLYTQVTRDVFNEVLINAHHAVFDGSLSRNYHTNRSDP